MNGLDIERATLDSLRYESGYMPPVERRALHSAQALLRRIDKAAALHTCADLFEECRECGHPFPCPTIRALGADR